MNNASSLLPSPSLSPAAELGAGRRAAEWLLERTVLPLARRSAGLRSLLRYTSTRVPGIVTPHAETVYAHLRECFIRNGHSSQYDEAVRRTIVDRFEEVERRVEMGSTPTDGLFLAEAALSVTAQGDLVECGCFQGGSTAKLSIVAKVTGRKLIVFDSFAGLPETDDYNRHDLHVRLPSSFMNPWTAGHWQGTLDAVRSHVANWGEIGVCTFVKGWFKDTLTPPHLPAAIALAFTDVDLPSSARECLEALWPRLADRGVYFSHDVGFIKVLQELTDERLWRDTWREPVPIVFGAGYGMGDTSRMLGFMIKGRDLPAEYVNSLTVDK